jgi:tetratricopeptide (TPR) repeat protein
VVAPVVTVASRHIIQRAGARLRQEPNNLSRLLGGLQRAQPRRPEALALAAQMRALLTAAELWYGLATLNALLGNTDAAIEHLRQAANQGKIDREWARIDPDLASIRHDPRFGEIVGIA